MRDETLPEWARWIDWKFPWSENTGRAIRSKDEELGWIAYFKITQWYVHLYKDCDYFETSHYNNDLGPFPTREAALAILRMVYR